MSDADRLLARQHSDPHAYLGAHQQNGSVVVRAFRPAAAHVTVAAGDAHVELGIVGRAGEGELRALDLVALAKELDGAKRQAHREIGGVQQSRLIPHRSGVRLRASLRALNSSQCLKLAPLAAEACA